MCQKGLNNEYKMIVSSASESVNRVRVITGRYSVTETLQVFRAETRKALKNGHFREKRY